MEILEEVELCFPQLLNASCKKPMRTHFEIILSYIILSSITLLTTTLNLLVIISISHFKYGRLSAWNWKLNVILVWWKIVSCYFLCSLNILNHKCFAGLPLQAAPQPHQPPPPLSGCLRFLRGPPHILSNYTHRWLLVPRWPHVYSVLCFRLYH